MILQGRGDAYALLAALGASKRLMQHAEQVSLAADLLLLQFQALGIPCDSTRVQIGAVLHDAGKVVHPEELAEPGCLHEQAGEALVRAHGVEPAIARCCLTHAQWDLPGVSLEERTIALADKLWKGKRDAALELRVIDDIAALLDATRWDVFEQLDSAFERIAEGGTERLQETMPS